MPKNVNRHLAFQQMKSEQAKPALRGSSEVSRALYTKSSKDKNNLSYGRTIWDPARSDEFVIASDAQPFSDRVAKRIAGDCDGHVSKRIDLNYNPSHRFIVDRYAGTRARFEFIAKEEYNSKTVNDHLFDQTFLECARKSGQAEVDLYLKDVGYSFAGIFGAIVGGVLLCISGKLIYDCAKRCSEQHQAAQAGRVAAAAAKVRENKVERLHKVESQIAALQVEASHLASDLNVGVATVVVQPVARV